MKRSDFTPGITARAAWWSGAISSAATALAMHFHGKDAYLAGVASVWPEAWWRVPLAIVALIAGGHGLWRCAQDDAAGDRQ